MKNSPPEQWKYYGDAPEMDFNIFSHESAYRFIRGTYKIGSKDRIFDVGFQRNFESTGKHEHTVILYFLGCMFKDIINNSLNKYLLSFIPGVNNWYDFLYTWFLTCLYHDTATVIEKSKWSLECSSDIDFYLDKYDVQHNVFDRHWTCAKPYTYSQDLIRNYFKYRVEHCHSIDHGIIAGYLLYDRLVKNYNDAWRQHSQSNPHAEFDYFFHKGLIWRKDHLSHFAIVSDTIIAHNIWLNKDAALYKKYGLNSLISSDNSTHNNKLTIGKNPLVFFLDLFDTMEPIKFFSRVQPKEVLEFIDMKKEQNKIVVSMESNILKPNGWHKKIADMKDWLIITVSEKVSIPNSESFTVSI
jgi:hypothetical protein